MKTGLRRGGRIVHGLRIARRLTQLLGRGAIVLRLFRFFRRKKLLSSAQPFQIKAVPRGRSNPVFLHELAERLELPQLRQPADAQLPELPLRLALRSAFSPEAGFNERDAKAVFARARIAR